MKTSFFALIFAVLLGPGCVAQSTERLGELELADVFLQPSFYFGEPKSGRFLPGEYFLTVRYTRSQIVSGVVRLGSLSLLNIPLRHGSQRENEWGGLEAYVQGDSVYGRGRLGLVPISFGLEGGDRELELWFPRSLFHKRRWLPLRDHGGSYAIEYGEFYSHWAIHNGEAGKDLDNEIWLTTGFGLRGRDYELGVSGATGRTSPLSTSASGAAASAVGFDTARDARFRMGAIHFQQRWPDLTLSVEAMSGDVRQGSDDLNAFWSGHIDAVVRTWKGARALVRYEILEPIHVLGGRQVSESSLGINFEDRYSTSNFMVLATRVDTVGQAQPSHEARVIWRLTPQLKR